MIEHTANLFSLINSCDATITIPYSSVAYVSAFLKTPSIFYDPTGDLLPPESFEYDIIHINCQNQLLTTLKSIILKK